MRFLFLLSVSFFFPCMLSAGPASRTLKLWYDEPASRWEEAFWRCVQEDTPPPVDGSGATSAALETIYAEGRGGTADLFGLEGELKAILEVKEEMKCLKERLALHENAVKERMKDAEEGRCGGFRAAWTNQTRRTFDARRYAQEHPELDLAGYYNTSTFRTFTVKEQEQ